MTTYTNPSVTTPTVDLTEPRYPGKGVGYDWRSLLAAREAEHLDEELQGLIVAAND